MSDKNLKLKLEAVLDKVKSPVNAKLKLFAPKIKVGADTTQAAKKIKKLGQQNSKTAFKPAVNNSY